MSSALRYGRMNYVLPIALPREKRAELAAVIRRFRTVKAVLVDEKLIRIWYVGTLPAQEIQQLAIAAVRAAKEAAITPAERLAEYRRDALVSLAGFAAVQILRKTSPELFAATKIARSLLTIFLARKFITNGIKGPLQEHQLNADTLTATAVIASVLAGKPESSLTLLTLSNGAEMLTSYAAERAHADFRPLVARPALCLARRERRGKENSC